MEGDSNEKVQAGAGQEAGDRAVSEKPEKRKSQALVSGGGDPPAGGEGAEQQEEPTGETGEGAGVVSDGLAKDGNDTNNRRTGKMGAAAELAEGDTAANGAGDGGASGAPQPDSEANVGGGDVGTSGGGAAADPDAPESLDGNPPVDLGQDGAALLKWLLEDTGLETQEELVDMAKVGTSLMSRIGEIVNIPGTFHEWSPAEDPAEIVDDMFQHIEDLEEMRAQFRGMLPGIDIMELRGTPEGCAEVAAIMAYGVTLAMADQIRRNLLGPDEAPPDRPLKVMMLMDMAAFVRKIGERATADVVGQQLKILKHRERPELSHSEAVAVSAFIHVLRELDGLAADEQAAIDKVAAVKGRAEPEPLPIAETTMEPVDGPMDTWGM